MAMTLLELVLSILAKVKKPASPSKPPVAPPPLPPVQPTPPVIITPPTTTGPGPAGATPVATALAITTQPSSAATSGVPFTTQPVVQVVDQFGSPFSAVKSIGVAVATGSSILSGATPINSNSSGVATFSGLELTNADTCTLRFTSTGLTSVTSNAIVVASGGGFANPDVLWQDFSATNSQGTTGGLVGGRNFTNGNPGHATVISNVTGIPIPWTKSTSMKLLQINYDPATGGTDIDLYLDFDPTAFGFTFSYGSTFYQSMWVMIGSTGTIAADSDKRKYFYCVMNGDHPTTSETDIVFNSYNPTALTWGGETDTQGASVRWPATTLNITKGVWHYVEMKITIDSAPGAGVGPGRTGSGTEGTVTLWVDDPTTPLINNATVPVSDIGYPAGSAFRLTIVRFGHQLEVGTTQELRLFGPMGFSTQRIGPL